MVQRNKPMKTRTIKDENDLTIDGEIIGKTPLHVEMLPKLLNVLV